MCLAQERRLIADHGRRMTGDQLVVGTSGNLSIRSGDLLAVTPAGHAYDTLTPELVCVVRLDGTQNAPATPRSSYARLGLAGGLWLPRGLPPAGHRRVAAHILAISRSAVPTRVNSPSGTGGRRRVVW
jgi:hypothetical protein